jgi:hypothetical protein
MPEVSALSSAGLHCPASPANALESKKSPPVITALIPLLDCMSISAVDQRNSIVPTNRGYSKQN